MSDRITYEEWVSELSRVTVPAGADGLTLREIRTMLGKGEDSARNLIRQAIEAGEWECAGSKPVTSLSGARASAPCYRPRRKP
jgi:hypothetical protein